MKSIQVKKSHLSVISLNNFFEAEKYSVRFKILRLIDIHRLKRYEIIGSKLNIYNH